MASHFLCCVQKILFVLFHPAGHANSGTSSDLITSGCFLMMASWDVRSAVRLRLWVLTVQWMAHVSSCQQSGVLDTFSRMVIHDRSIVPLKLNIKILKQPLINSLNFQSRSDRRVKVSWTEMRGLPVEPRLQFAVLYGDLWRRTANSSSRKRAAAVETSLKI